VGQSLYKQAASNRLSAETHTVKALVRKGSEAKLPTGAIPVIADVFEEKVFRMKYGGFNIRAKTLCPLFHYYSFSYHSFINCLYCALPLIIDSFC
jgi:hypothetical protein